VPEGAKHRAMDALRGSLKKTVDSAMRTTKHRDAHLRTDAPDLEPECNCSPLTATGGSARHALASRFSRCTGSVAGGCNEDTGLSEAIGVGRWHYDASVIQEEIFALATGDYARGD